MSFVPPLGIATLMLAQAAAPVPDRMVVIARPEGWQAWVAVLADLATILIGLALIAVAIALIVAALQSRKIYGRVHALLDRAHGELKPLIGHATEVAENVNQVSAAVRGDVDRFRARMETAQQRLTEAAGATEHRIRRFNALLDVVQDEAEGLFITTASTLRGVQAGARTLQGDAGEVEWDPAESRTDPPQSVAERRPRRHT